MCVLAWHWQPGGTTPLLLLSNRDEYYARPTQPLRWWSHNQGPRILAGQDLQAGGTWLGVNQRGWLAALTNFRSGQTQRTDTPSRGGLVEGFLRGDADAPTYLQGLAARVGDYNPFNLLVFDGQQLLGLESRHARLLRLEPGLGGVSNADFNSAWPKLDQLKSGLQTGLQRPAAPSTEWLDLLQSRTPVPDAQLPCTGVALEWERSLASTFVSTAVYGTRASSVVRIGSTQVEFVEQVFDANGPVSRQQIEFCLSP